jgi:hypothetical protein
LTDTHTYEFQWTEHKPGSPHDLIVPGEPTATYVLERVFQITGGDPSTVKVPVEGIAPRTVMAYVPRDQTEIWHLPQGHGREYLTLGQAQHVAEQAVLASIGALP